MLMLRCPERWREGIREWEPPTCALGSPCKPGEEDWLWPGVRGYAVEAKGKIYIPLIIAEPAGEGNVGRFLDSLSYRCVIPNVTSKRLEGMLERRGWAVHTESDPKEGTCEVWSQVGRAR